MMIKQLSVLAMLIICSMEDMKNKQIHTKWLAGFAAEGILCWMFLYKQPVMGLLAAVFPGLAVLMLAFMSRGGIGEGDGFLIAVTGIFLGAACTFRILIYAVFLSAGCALFLYIVKKKSRKYEMPFVPFLLAAFVGELCLRAL